MTDHNSFPRGLPGRPMGSGGIPVRALILSTLLAQAMIPSSLLGQVGRESGPGGLQPLTLVEAVELALGHHPAVGEAEARRDAAEGVLSQLKGTLLPTVATDASLIHYEEPMLVAPLHGFDPTMAPSFDRDLLRGNLTFVYSLFEGGARTARIDGAEAGSAMAVAGSSATRMDVTVQVGAAYLDLLSTGELLAAAEDQREALESELARVRLFQSAGKAAEVELLRVQAALSQAEALEISLRSRAEVALGRLGRLTGLSSETVRARGTLPVTMASRPAPALSTATARAREGNPDLSGARERLASAAAGVRVARGAWYPSVRVTGAYSNFGALDGGHTQEWQGALQFSYPLFTGGGREGEMDRAAAEERRASEALRLAEMQVEDGVEDALATLSEVRARREALERGVAQAAEVARIEALALEAGAGVQTDFLKSQADYFQARASLAQARHGEVLAAIQLARVTGDLSLGWLQENTEVVR